MSKSNSKAVLHFVAILLTVVTIIALAVGLFAWSKYTANNTGTATAEIARWNFNLSLQAGQTTVTGNQVLDLADTLDEEATHVADGKIAPGTSGTFDIVIDTSGTEVSMLYDVTITTENCPRNIKFSKKGPGENNFTEISPMQTGDETTRVRTINFSKYLRAQGDNQENENGVKTETIKWEWPYELTSGNAAQKQAYDTRDNQDQGQTATISITAVGTEVMNTPLINATITDNDLNIINDGGTVTVYTEETVKSNKLNITGSEAVSFTSQDTSVATVSQDGTITAVAEGNTVVTLIGQETGKTVNVNVAVKPAIRAMINGVSTVLTPDNTGNYYGSIVTNYTVNDEEYQLFFIDWNNKFLAGKGTIYVKKKEYIERTSGLPTNNYDINSSVLKIKEMNPLWASNNNQVINTRGEKAAAWLCDTTVWSEYALGTYALYAIGGPSVEMFIDSYNESVDVYNKINSANEDKKSYFVSTDGYIIYTSTIRKNYIGKNSMYVQGYGIQNNFWFCSPAQHTEGVWYTDGSGFTQNYGYYIHNCVDPLVCLSSDFPLQLEY